MGTMGNVIVLENAKKVFFDKIIRGDEEVALTKSEEMELLEKARRTVDEMESLWEEDHTVAELRDQFHLLRHYLERLSRAMEDAEKNKTTKEE